MIELLVNGELISGLDEVKMTKSVNDLGNLPSRQGEWSVTLTAPPSKSNLFAFGFAEQVNANTRIPKQVNSYELYESGVLVSNGTAKILRYNNGIEFVLLSNNSDWVSALGDALLRQLDVIENDYSLIPSAVASRRLNTAKMCLPNVFYNFKDNARPYDVFDFKPCFYVSYLIDKIFSSLGYSLVNNMLPNQLSIYNKIITIPSTNWVQQSYVGISFKGITVNDPATSSLILSVPIILGGDKCYCAEFPTSMFTGLGFPISGKMNNVATSLGTSMNIKCKFIRPNRIVGYVDVTFDTNQTIPQDVWANLYTYSGVTPVFYYQVGGIKVSTAGTYRVDINVDISDPSILPSSDGLDVFLGVLVPNFFTSGVGFCDVINGEITVYDDGYNNLPQLQNSVDEFVADTAGCLPDLKQTDLIVTVINQFNLLVSTNTLTKEVTFTPFDKLLENITSAIDWSNKVDLAEQPEIIYDFFDKYFQNSYFRYKQDDKDTLLNGATIGDGFIIYDNENNEVKGDVFESELSAIGRETESTASVEIASCKFYPDVDLNPKLGVAKITTDNLVTQYGQAAPTQSNEVFFNDISFANLLPQNYKGLQRILSNNLAIRLQVRLTRSDFTNVDFSTPIFLDIITDNGQIRGHFYINKINQYNVGQHDSCEVTLIQID